MTDYVICSDNISGNEKSDMEAIAKVLEDAGHTCEVGNVDPNSLQSYGNQEGKIGIMLVGGSDIGMYYDFQQGVEKGYYKYDKMVIAFDGWSTENEHTTCDGVRNKKLHMAHDDNYSTPEARKKLDGKYTAHEYITEHSEQLGYGCGNTPEDVANMILNGVSGGSTSSKGENKPMSGWESLCDLLKPLDGLAMMVQRGDTVIVKRITVPEENMGDASKVTHVATPNPNKEDDENSSDENSETEPLYTSYRTYSDTGKIENPTVDDTVKLYAYEGVNIVADSATVTEYTPEIYNTLKVSWGESGENEFTLCFEKHKELYGERLKEVQALNKETITEDSSSEANTKSDSSEEDKDKSDDKKTTSTSNSSNESTPIIQEVPIVNYDEALAWGMRELGKQRRKSGHKIELKVIGNTDFKVGEWCRVYMPTYNEDCFMFISKASVEAGADEEFITSLTLVDYPPSLGAGEMNSISSSNSDDESSNSSSLDASTNTSNGSTSTSDSEEK